MNSRATAIRIPRKGFFATSAFPTRKLEYGGFGMSDFGMRGVEVAGLIPLHCIEHLNRIFNGAADDTGTIGVCLVAVATIHHDSLGREQTDSVGPEAGPLQEPPVCSQIEQCERFAATDAPEPELDPRGTRSVS